ncbi:mechanosensitive ion channel family protein [Streptococcus sp. DD12]|uniref:mechanosensitive ion channel family protein n=1 Tax=Streptococcus sp. DD12 TaxID=1777880 RepID=UPI00079281E5|nr:mechanosensitive ion channel family protein [Streptococcus sp. DD12]KXT75984.1 Potassium efflux system KefA protein / Small-conductance mechanosensitive channel [Streptococcus sp. DD12]
MAIIERYIASLNLEGLVNSLISKGISLIVLYFFFFLGKRAITFSFDKVLSKSVQLTKQTSGRQKTILRLSNSFINYCLYFLLLYWTLDVIGLPVSSLLAGAGIAGVAIGLGAQGFLTDVVNGFFILLENQYDVGDAVEIGTVSGNVVSVGIRTTQVRSADGTLNFIPNRNITIVSNKSRGDMRALIDLPLSADVDLQKVTQIITEVNQVEVPNHPEIVGFPNILGPQTSATTGQFFFRVAIFTESGKQIDTYHTFYQLYQEALRTQGISLATSPSLFGQ